MKKKKPVHPKLFINIDIDKSTIFFKMAIFMYHYKMSFIFKFSINSRSQWCKNAPKHILC